MENEIYVVIGIGLVLLFLLTVPTFSIGSGVGDINISDSNAVVDLNIFLTSDQNWLITPFIINQPSSGFTIPVPAALSDFSMRKSNRIVLDLNNASQYRIILDSNTPASGTAVNARIGLQFSDDNSIFYDANISSGGYLNLGATNAGPHPKYSDWIDINQTVNRPNIIYRLVTIDGNGSSFSIPLVQVQMRGPIRSNNFVTNNYTTSGGGGSGTTYTSGTPATIQVNNDLNTISQNFDGNFASRFDANFWRMFALGEPYIDGNALTVVNNLDLNNSLNYIKKGSDGNGSILGTTNQVSVTNGLSRLFGDANVVLSLPQNIDTGASPTFIGMTLSPCTTFQMDTSPQLRFKVDCSSSLITATSQIPTQPGISDIGNSSNRYDDLWITDINATGTNDFKTICIGGDCKTSWPTSVSSDTNCSTSADCNSMYIQKNPLTDQNINNQDLNIYNGQLVLQAGQNIANTNDNIFEIWNQNGTRTLRTDQNGNMVLDGNLTFIDANSFVGGVGATQGRRVRYNGLDYTGNATTGGGNLWISANTYAFAVTGTLTSGLYFDASAPRGFKFRIDGGERFIFGAGSANTDGAIWQIIRNTGTTGMLDGAWYFKDIGQKDMNWQPYIRRNGIENHWNAQVYLGTPKDSANDANWTGDINGNGDWRLNDGNYYGQLISPGNLVGVSCNTTCGAYSYGGPWTCVEATNITGTASTCSDTTVAHNCLCRN